MTITRVIRCDRCAASFDISRSSKELDDWLRLGDADVCPNCLKTPMEFKRTPLQVVVVEHQGLRRLEGVPTRYIVEVRGFGVAISPADKIEMEQKAERAAERIREALVSL